MLWALFGVAGAVLCLVLCVVSAVTAALLRSVWPVKYWGIPIWPDLLISKFDI